MLTLISKRRIFQTALLLLPLCWQSCQSNMQEKAHQVNGKSAVQQDTMVYQTRTIKEISPYIAEHDGQLDSSFAEVSYPVFEDSSMNQIINRSILLDGEPNIQTYVNNFIEGYGNFVEENDLQYPIAWHKSTQVLIPFYTPGLISIKNATYEFSGGAHGNYFENLSVYDLENFRKLELNTFISENKMKEFTKIAENIFRKGEGLSDTSNLEKGYFFENGTFSLAANYAINKEGFLFHYNPYEIKPFAEGTTTILVPYQQVEELMTQTGKLYIKNINTYYQSIQ